MSVHRLGRIVLLTLGLASGVLATAGAPAGAEGPTASVTPTAGLADGQRVAIRGSGFEPFTRIQVLECAGTAKRPPKDNHECQGLTLDSSAMTDGGGSFVNSPDDPTRRTHGYRVVTLPKPAMTPLGPHCGPTDPCGLYVGVQETDFARPHVFVALSFTGAPAPHRSATSRGPLVAGVLLSGGAIVAGLLVWRRRGRRGPEAVTK